MGCNERGIVEHPDLDHASLLEPPGDVHVFGARPRVANDPSHFLPGRDPVHVRHPVGPLQRRTKQRVDAHELHHGNRQPVNGGREHDLLVRRLVEAGAKARDVADRGAVIVQRGERRASAPLERAPPRSRGRACRCRERLAEEMIDGLHLIDHRRRGRACRSAHRRRSARPERSRCSAPSPLGYMGLGRTR